MKKLYIIKYSYNLILKNIQNCILKNIEYLNGYNARHEFVSIRNERSNLLFCIIIIAMLSTFVHDASVLVKLMY